MSDVILQADQLTKTFRDGQRMIEVFHDISFGISSGESVAIIGASGAGKSTLLHLLGGLDVPTSGQVKIKGTDFSALNSKKRGQVRNRELGFVYQFHHLLPEFSALENVMMPLLIGRISKTQARSRAQKMLEQVGLGERLTHRPAQLSGGERQRAAIARALVTHPACLLADEPTGNLDETTAAQTVQLMKQLNNDLQTALVIVTHDLQLAAQMDTVYELKQGVLHKSELTTEPI